MNARFLLIGTLTCALAIFAWQTVSNTVLDAVIPWHMETMRELAADDATVQAIRNGAPRNGVYYSHQGVFAVVALVPGVSDRRTLVPSRLARQAVIDLVASLFIVLLVSRMPVQTPLATGVTVAVAGIASAMVIEASNWNWYGFALGFVSVNVIDQAIQFFVGGLALGVAARALGTTVVRTAEFVGVPAGGGYTAQRPGTRAKT